jgi:hypothetical protein
MSKVIVIDGGILSHKSIFAWNSMQKLKNEGKLRTDFIPNSDYTYFNSMVSILKKISIQKDDTVIVAVDARNSWRKAFYPIYKAQRSAGRAKHTLIDWDYHYGLIEDMNETLHQATDWHFVKMSDFASFNDLEKTKYGKQYAIKDNDAKRGKPYGIEADDIQAVACRYFSDREVILVTGDADLDQLDHYENTRIFSTNTKFKGQKGCYKVIKDPINVLTSKAKKGDVSDNIIVSETNDTTDEYELRKFIIDLYTLPDFVEDPIVDILSQLPEKKMYYDKLPFPNSLGKAERYDKIYSQDKLITWDEAVKSHERAEKRKKKKAKISYEKRKLKLKIQKENAFR